MGSAALSTRRQELRNATRMLQERCQYESAAWAAELMAGLDLSKFASCSMIYKLLPCGSIHAHRRQDLSLLFDEVCYQYHTTCPIAMAYRSGCTSPTSQWWQASHDCRVQSAGLPAEEECVAQEHTGAFTCPSGTQAQEDTYLLAKSIFDMRVDLSSFITRCSPC